MTIFSPNTTERLYLLTYLAEIGTHFS